MKYFASNHMFQQVHCCLSIGQHPVRLLDLVISSERFSEKVLSAIVKAPLIPMLSIPVNFFIGSYKKAQLFPQVYINPISTFKLLQQSDIDFIFGHIQDLLPLHESKFQRTGVTLFFKQFVIRFLYFINFKQSATNTFKLGFDFDFMYFQLR